MTERLFESCAMNKSSVRNVVCILLINVILHKAGRPLMVDVLLKSRLKVWMLMIVLLSHAGN